MTKTRKTLIFAIISTLFIFMSILQEKPKAIEYHEENEQITQIEALAPHSKELDYSNLDFSDSYQPRESFFYPLANEVNSTEYCGYRKPQNGGGALTLNCNSGISQVDDHISITVPNQLADVLIVGDVVDICIIDEFNEPIEFYKCHSAIVVDYNATNTININSVVDTHFIDNQYTIRMELTK